MNTNKRERTCKFLCIDFEEYAGPLFFFYDICFFVFLWFVVYALVLTTPPPHPISSYVVIGLLLLVLIVGNHAIFMCIEVHIVSNVMKTKNRCDLMKTIIICITAITGIRLKRILNPMMWLQLLFRISLFPILLSAFFSSGLFFAVEVAYNRSNEVILETFTTYPPRIKDPACRLTTGVDTSLNIFFLVTNNAFVMDALLALDGIYFNFLNYRYKLRWYYNFVMPKLKEACDGGYQVAILDDSVVGVSMLVCIGIIVFLAPFALFRDGRKMLQNVWLWLFTFAGISIAFIAYFFLSAAGIQFFAMVIKDSSWTRSAPPAGYDAFGSLIVMGVCALLLSVSSLNVRSTTNTNDELPTDDLDIIATIMKLITEATRLFVKIVLCEGAILAYVTLILAFLMGSFGVPLKHISFAKIDGARPYPEYMNENMMEIALTDVPGLDTNIVKYMYINVVTNVTETNGQLIGQLCNYIVQYVDVAHVGLSHAICDVTTNTLTDYFEALQIASVDLVFEALNAILNEFHMEGKSLLEWIDYALRQIVQLLDIDFGIQDFLNEIEDIAKQIPNVMPYIPVICVCSMLVLTILRLFLPSIAVLLQMAVLTGLIQLLVFGVAGVMTIRLLLKQYGYRIVVDVDYPILLFDLVVLIMCIASCFMLLQAEEQKLQVDADIERLVREFEADYNEKPTRESVRGETKLLLLQQRSTKKSKIVTRGVSQK